MTTTEPPSQRAKDAATVSSGRTLFRVRGVPVRADASILLLGGYFAFAYAYPLIRNAAPDQAPVVLALTVLASVLLLASILAHELGHALANLDRGIAVRSITLFALGGVTESTREATRARDEFVIVGIGPFISLVLAGAFGLLATALSPVPAAAVVAGLLGWTNLVLAVFNFVPAFPLDGGRLLRSIFWGVTGRQHQATRWAARTGQAIAVLFIAYSLLGLTQGGGGGFGNLWNVLIAFFLLRGATAAHKRAQMMERLDRVRIADVMGSVPAPLTATMSLREALEQVQERPSLLWPVGHPVQGTLLLRTIQDVPAEERDTRTVADVVIAASISTVDVATSLDDALERMINAPDNMLVVTENGRSVGLLTPTLLADVAG